MALPRQYTGYYFRSKRDGRWTEVDLSEMDRDQLEELIADKKPEWMANLIYGLCRQITGENER